MNQENWLPLIGWEGVYEISSLGHITRTKKHRRCNAGPLKCSAKVNGYPVVHLRDGPNKNASSLVHKLVALTFLGAPPSDQHQVNHKNGDRSDPRLINLEWVTCSENHIHAYHMLNRATVSNKGTAAGRAKLTDKNVIEIRRRYTAGGISQQSLADEFGVTQPMIGCIVRRVNWTHLD